MMPIAPIDAPETATLRTTPSGTGAELAALLHGTGTASLDRLGWVRVTGADRVRWLNGMVTNAIQGLAPGSGCYNFVLNAQGRIQGDLTAFALEDCILLEAERDRIPALIALFDRFIIMDDVELVDISDTRAGLGVLGPTALALLEEIGFPAPSIEPMQISGASWRGSPATLIHAHSPLVPRFELWGEPVLLGALEAALVSAGATPCGPESVEQLRLLEGTPLYGIDIRNSETARDLPQETGQTRALHFTKGCYLGQEIVERIRSRGNVHRAFTGFEIHGEMPSAGSALTAESKPAGELTSAAAIQLPGRAEPLQLALGYIRRETLEQNLIHRLPLEYPGGTATPVALPYTGS